MTLFAGLAAFPITPTTSAGKIIEPDLDRLVRRIEAGGADAVGLLGSTGSYMFLSRKGRRRAVRVALNAVDSLPVIVGVGALRTDDARAMAADAAAEGAAGLLLAPVSYMPLHEEEVFQHFHAVASVSDLPLCIYSNPTTTNFTFQPDFVARLAAIPTVAAIKLPLPSAGNVASDLAAFRSAAPGLSIGYSGDWGAKQALLAGADCWYSVAGGLFPRLAADLTAAAAKGDRGAADEHDAEFAGLWDLFRSHGSLRLMYAAANIMGLSHAQPPLPLLALDAQRVSQLRLVLPSAASSAKD